MKTLNSILIAVCALTVLPSTANAQDPQQLMDKMAGVYKHRFMSDSYSDGPYQAEDVIEIVPYDANHVYVRAHLEFYNGHLCGIAGMARFENGKFVYHDPQPPIEGHAPCALSVGIDKDKLTLSDRSGPEGESTCHALHCGMRGSLNYQIGMEKRRAIRYMDRLKSSRQYQQAIEDLRKTEP